MKWLGLTSSGTIMGPAANPGHLVIQDVLTLHGSQFRDAAVIVASPPCQKYSYMAMPWTRAKKLADWYWEDLSRLDELNALFNACFRIQREASEAAGHHIPMVVENVKGAQKWVGRAAWHFGSYYLWGDVPALMPFAKGIKLAHNTNSGTGQNPVNGRKGKGGSWMTTDLENRTPGHWKESGCVTRRFNSKDVRRKAASAQIAKIPFPLAQHIAGVYKPTASDVLRFRNGSARGAKEDERRDDCRRRAGLMWLSGEMEGSKRAGPEKRTER